MQIHLEGRIWHPVANYLIARMWDERFEAMALAAANNNAENDNDAAQLIEWLDGLPIG